MMFKVKVVRDFARIDSVLVGDKSVSKTLYYTVGEIFEVYGCSDTTFVGYSPKRGFFVQIPYNCCAPV